MSRHKFGNEAGHLTQWIKAGDIKFDPHVQRALNAHWAEYIGRNLDPNLMGVIHVSKRPNEDLFCVDGQHRLHGVTDYFGNNGTLVECKVYEGLSRAQEAALFVGLNNFRRPQRIDVFLKSVIAKEPTAVAINAIVREAGLRIDRGKADNAVSAVAALEDVYFAFADRRTAPPSKDDTKDTKETKDPKDRKPPQVRTFPVNAPLLSSTLTVIRDAWGGIADSMNGHIIVGVGRVLAARGRIIDLDDFAHKLAAFPGGPTALVGNAHGIKSMTNGKIGPAVAEVCIGVYNKGRRVGKVDSLRADVAAVAVA